mmetsp:Transcript_8489/g.17215  ORF Transcript_8489/g.17215 Transcript_8489/m.17215 type:complete len:137 (+) Transcript_8489:452-862(+)
MSQHTTFSKPGCVIFVKLWQFDPADRHQVRLDMYSTLEQAGGGNQMVHLYQDPREDVCFFAVEPSMRVDILGPGGIEIFVLDGTLIDHNDPYLILGRGSWLRLPVGSKFRAVSGADGGAKFWAKTGHLVYAAGPKL